MGWSSLAGAGVQALSSWLSNNLNMGNQEKLMDKQHAHNIELARLQQNYLLQNAKNVSSIERSSREQAGFNLNSEGGFSPLAGMSVPSTGSPSAPQMQSPDFASFANLFMQAPLVKAQTRKLNADAEAQEQENTGTKEENAWYSRVIQPSKDVDFDSNGNLVLGVSVPNQGATEESEMSGSLPGVDSVSSKLPPSTTKKGVLARKEARVIIHTELKEMHARELKAELEGAIADGQLKDSEVMQAFFKQPYWQQEYVCEQISELISRELLQDRQGQLALSEKELNVLEKNMSTNGLIEGIENDIEDGKGIKDVAKKVLKGSAKLILRKLFGRGK